MIARVDVALYERERRESARIEAARRGVFSENAARIEAIDLVRR